MSTEHLTTEAIHPGSAEIDQLDSLQIVRLINAEDATIAAAVGREAEAIAAAIDVITDRLSTGGRLIYIGAGTSGRLGVLDASECPPTFRTPPEMVVGLIAGGDAALRKAAEGVEDHPEIGEADLERIGLTSSDVVVGIASSGRTPYVIGGLNYARSIGAAAIGLVCNANAELAMVANLIIAPVVGPEIIAGSTRMKAGTATKMVLNMLSTGVMIRLGKTYGNLMVDLRASNTKLVARAQRLVSRIAHVSEAVAAEQLQHCDGEVKTAIVALRRAVDPVTARQLLAASNGHLRPALESVQQ